MALLVVAGLGLLSYDLYRVLTRHTIIGAVVDDDQQPVASAQISFMGESQNTDNGGHFTIVYRLLDLPAIVNATYRTSQTSATLDEGNRDKPLVLQVELPTNSHLVFGVNGLPQIERTNISPDGGGGSQPIKPLDDKSILPPKPRLTTWKALNARYHGMISFLLVAGPICLLGLCFWWFYWSSFQLIRRKGQNHLRLDLLRVKGPGIQLFNSSSFRRTVQELRRHRQVESMELDPDRLVIESALWPVAHLPCPGQRIIE